MHMTIIFSQVLKPHLKKNLFMNPNICSYSFIRYETTFCENILFLSGQKGRFEKVELDEIVKLASKFVKLLFRIDFSMYKTEFSRSVTEKTVKWVYLKRILPINNFSFTPLMGFHQETESYPDVHWTPS